MSQYETELRRRLAADKVDLYETISWFLAAIGAQDFIDGKPGEPDLSWFEREFLTANAERYQQERVQRMSIVELIVGRVTAG
jgi:hypothetical protein